MNEAKWMMLGLAAASAAKRVDVPVSEIREMVWVLTEHPVQCECAICTAYAGARTTAEGLLAALAVVEAAREERRRAVDAPGVI